MEVTYAGVNIDVNEEGYLTDLNQWNENVAREIAASEEVGELTEKHWEVIGYIQDQYRNEARLSIRSIGKSGITTIKEFYQLFPGAPLKKASKISGIPKPASCI
jgi:tRNA 2-thiouridine synthesizing protein E